MPLSIPQTEPATELIDGRLGQKMSPYERHAHAQAVLVATLLQWADAKGRGRVGTEWDFDLTPLGDRTHRLVPDVAFLSYDRVAYEDETAAQVPTIGPDVAFEILSQGQTLENLRRRIEIFRACGTPLVVLIDPYAEEGWIIDADGNRRLTRDDVVEHPALPEFALPLKRCFERVPPGGFLER